MAAVSEVKTCLQRVFQGTGWPDLEACLSCLVLNGVQCLDDLSLLQERHLQSLLGLNLIQCLRLQREVSRRLLEQDGKEGGAKRQRLEAPDRQERLPASSSRPSSSPRLDPEAELEIANDGAAVRHLSLAATHQLLPEDKLIGALCSICQVSFRPGRTAARLACLHVFHAMCINQWFQSRGQRRHICPVCRHNVQRFEPDDMNSSENDYDEDEEEEDEEDGDFVQDYCIVPPPPPTPLLTFGREGHASGGSYGGTGYGNEKGSGYGKNGSGCKGSGSMDGYGKSSSGKGDGVYGSTGKVYHSDGGKGGTDGGKDSGKTGGKEHRQGGKDIGKGGKGI